MKLKLPLLLLGAALSLQAGEFKKQRWQFNVGPIFNFARYDLDCLPKIQGYLAGIHTDFTYRKPRMLYSQIQFDGRWNAGYICGEFDIKTKIRDYRPEFFLGYNFSFNDENSMLLTPLVGFGFYHLSNELQPDVMTYRYFNIYVPVGLDFLWQVREDEFDIGLRALYRADVYTKLKLTTPCIEECECDKIDLKRSHGVHLEMPFTWYRTHRHRANFQFKVVPFFDWNRFGRADEANSNGLCLEIPQLDRWHLGLRLDFGVRF